MPESDRDSDRDAGTGKPAIDDPGLGGYRQTMMRRFFLLTFAAVASCTAGPLPPTGDIAGTWGGDNSGLIATDSTAHVHIGCTVGDVNGPIHPDSRGTFDASGLYDVDASPIGRGILHPARFTGRITGRTMVLTVTLTDTTRTLGPVLLTYGREPRMQACPICRVPALRLRTP